MNAQLGDDREARRLEELAADALTVHGPLAKEPALLRLAMLRGNLETLEQLLAVNPEIDFWDVDYPAARLDGLAAVDDRRGVEAEAPRALESGATWSPSPCGRSGRCARTVRSWRELRSVSTSSA